MLLPAMFVKIVLGKRATFPAPHTSFLVLFGIWYKRTTPASWNPGPINAHEALDKSSRETRWTDRMHYYESHVVMHEI